MKIKMAFLLLFFVGFSLFAQELRDARIFVPPVVGAGNNEEKAFFHQKLTYEVILQNYGLAASRNNSEYILTAVIMPRNEFELLPIPPVRNSRERREFFSWDIDDSLLFYDTAGDENYQPNPGSSSPDQSQVRLRQDGNNFLVLQLVHRRNGETAVRGHISFNTPDASAGEDISVVLYNMLSRLPKIEEYSDWRNRWMFLEISGLWTPRIYSNEGSSLYLSNFGIAIGLELQFLNFLSLYAGAQVTQDWILVSGSGGDRDRDVVLEVPLALRFVFKLGDDFLLEPYGGVSYNYSLMKITEPSMFSWFAGFQFGVKAGPGMIFIDQRFSQDFYNSSMGAVEYQRTMLQIGLGYKFGVLPKPPVVRHY